MRADWISCDSSYTVKNSLPIKVTENWAAFPVRTGWESAHWLRGATQINYGIIYKNTQMCWSFNSFRQIKITGFITNNRVLYKPTWFKLNSVHLHGFPRNANYRSSHQK
jgi:hypothetical protein